MWQPWVQRKREFRAASFTPLGGPGALSTGVSSTGSAQAFVDLERIDVSGPTRRYYRYVMNQAPDGRVFQLGPLKDVKYGHHHNRRPTAFASEVGSRSTST